MLKWFRKLLAKREEDQISRELDFELYYTGILAEQRRSHTLYVTEQESSGTIGKNGDVVIPSGNSYNDFVDRAKLWHEAERKADTNHIKWNINAKGL